VSKVPRLEQTLKALLQQRCLAWKPYWYHWTNKKGIQIYSVRANSAWILYDA